MEPVTLFLSYAHEDEALRNELAKHLRLLERQDVITTWHDRQIVPGTDWAHEIDTHLNQASVILLLVSPDFLASDYCYDSEMQHALERHRRGEARVVPIILRDCDWSGAAFAHLQCLPRNARPITLWKNQDTAFRDVAKGIRTTVEHLSGSSARNSTPSISSKNRQGLLKQVRRVWIEGVLEHSLHNAALITLGLHEQPDAVENPWRLTVQESALPEHPLAAGTRIRQVYDDADCGLLILGEPGSGKTTLLLELVRDLLDRADHDERHLMPIVFNLSSWAEKRQSLSEWLIGELSAKYQIQRKIGKLWVETGQVLPLLDGLDEVAEEYRAACVETINAYRQDQGQEVPLVVCSRTTEYLAQATRVSVQKAVLIQALTVRQINNYLEGAEEQLKGLQAWLRKDPSFLELAQTPLMLSILTLTYHGKSVEDIANEAQKHPVFAAYVQRMFERRSSEKHYTSEQTKSWLIWLAQRMRQQDQTAFYLERLQIDWLAKSRLGEIYTSLAFGLLSFPVAAIVCGLEFGSFLNGAFVGVLVAFIAFFFVLLIETNFRVGSLFPRKNRRTPITTESKRSGESSRLTAFLTQLLGERAGFALLSGLLNWLLVQFLIGPFYAPTDGLYLAAFLIVLGKFEKKIQPAEKLVWSWTSLWQNAGKSLLQGLGIGFLVGFFDALPYFQTLSVFLTTLYFWLSFGFALGLIIMLMRGFSKDMLDTQKIIKPNQGIRNSLSNSLRLGLPSGLLLGVVAFFFFSFVIQNVFRVGYLSQLPQNADIAFGADGAVAVTYLFWLINGGFACVQHLMVRFCLWQTKCTPWRYPQFLDYAHERILLRRVGGGYIFVHKLLLDYFANLSMEEGSNVPPAESKQPETTFSTPAKSSGDEEDGDKTVPLVLVPVLSEVPRLLPCGHEQRDTQARSCSVCGRPIPPGYLEP